MCLSAANARHQEKRNRVKSSHHRPVAIMKSPPPPPTLQSSMAINHLFLGRDFSGHKNSKLNRKADASQQVVTTYASGGIPGGYNTATPQTEREHSGRRAMGSRGATGR